MLGQYATADAEGRQLLDKGQKAREGAAKAKTGPRGAHTGSGHGQSESTSSPVHITGCGLDLTSPQRLPNKRASEPVLARSAAHAAVLEAQLRGAAYNQKTLRAYADGATNSNDPAVSLMAKGVAVGGGALRGDADGDDGIVRLAGKAATLRLNLDIVGNSGAHPGAGGRYQEWDSMLTQRTSADSPRWVSYKAQEQDSPGDFRPDSSGLGGLGAPPLTPSILRLTSDSRGSCGPMWSSQELAELPFVDDIVSPVASASPPAAAMVAAVAPSQS